jgi:hypothetical protein
MDQAVDSIRQRYGNGSVFRSSFLNSGVASVQGVRWIVFCKRKFLNIAKIFPQAPVGNFLFITGNNVPN